MESKSVVRRLAVQKRKFVSALINWDSEEIRIIGVFNSMEAAEDAAFDKRRANEDIFVSETQSE